MDDVYQPMLQGVFIPYRLKYDGHHDCCYATHAATKHIIQLIKYCIQTVKKSVCWGIAGEARISMSLPTNS